RDLPLALVRLRAGHRAMPDGGRLPAAPVSRGHGGRPALRVDPGRSAAAELVADPARARQGGLSRRQLRSQLTFHALGSAGEYEQRVPIHRELRRCAASSGWTCPILDKASRTRALTVLR